MDLEERPFSRAIFEQNLDGKLGDPGFGFDMSGLLAAGREWDPIAAARVVTEQLVSRLPGEAWQGRKPRAGRPVRERTASSRSPRRG